MAETKKVLIKIKRQAGPQEPSRWEEFSLNWRPSMNVIICLRDIAENPVTSSGKKTTPITYRNCLEVCPQVNEHNQFVGAAIISQVRLFNIHPTGAMNKRERLEALMGPGGVQECANAQNCVKACPKNIPLTESIAEVNRDAWKQALLGWLLG